MTLKDITLRVFKRCLFERNYEGVDNFEDLYDEFISLSGLGENEQLGLLSATIYYQCRIKFIDGWMNYQRSLIRVVNMPDESAFADIKSRYGHHITFNGDLEKFEKDIKRIELLEKRNVVELRKLEKERETAASAEKSHDDKQARNQFLIMINVLRKDGWKIEEDLPMDEVALIIKEQARQIDAMRTQVKE